MTRQASIYDGSEWIPLTGVPGPEGPPGEPGTPGLGAITSPTEPPTDDLFDGTLWINPDYGSTLPVIGTGPLTWAYTNLTIGVQDVFYDVPDYRHIILTAPPKQGGVLVVTQAFSIFMRSTIRFDMRLHEKTTDNQLIRIRSERAYTQDSTVPCTLTASLPVPPGETVDVALQYAYPTSLPSVENRILNGRWTYQWFPGALYRDAADTGSAVRVWTGGEWLPQGRAEIDDTSTTSPPPPGGRFPTSTVVAKNLTTKKITATVTGGVNGATVTFKRNGNTVGSGTVSGGVASFTINNAGTWTATYNGDATTLPSDSSNSVTITRVSNTVSQNARWVQAYNGSGNKISGSGQDSAWHQGYYSATHGNRRSLIGFHRLLNTTGYTNHIEVTKVELRLSNSHAYYNGGLTLSLGRHTNTGSSAPNTLSGTAAGLSNHSMSKGVANQWFDITSWASSRVNQDVWGGVCIGAANTNTLQHYGYGSGANADCILRITYDRWE